MSIGSPSRFLKKLDIYQQIRSGQGITKYKRLWKYERAFLQAAYGEPHQHLNSFSDKNQVIEWIKKSVPEYSHDNYEEVIGNLFYKGYLEARQKTGAAPSQLITRDNMGIRNDSLAQGFECRATVEGLLVGEVLSEIYNTDLIIRWWNKYRYSLILDTVWLVAFLGVYKIFFFNTDISNYFDFHIVGIHVTETVFKILFVFLIWPIVNWMYRVFYLGIERSLN